MSSDRTDVVLKEMERLTETQFLPIVGPEKGKILAKTVREVKPKRALEVGTLIGYSAILIARELDKDARLYTLEIHEDEARMAKENIKRAGLIDKVSVIVGNALETIPKLKDSFDFVFIDAEKTEYFRYLRLVDDKLHKSSVIVADNAGIFAKQMHGYLDCVRGSKYYSSKFVSVGEDGLEITTRIL